MISFCNCTKSDLFLTFLASVVSPRVMLSGLVCGAAASGCLCRQRPFHAAIMGPELDREIELESLGSLQKDSGAQAKLLLFLKAKLKGWCEGAVTLAWKTLLCGGRSAGSSCGAVDTTSCYLSGGSAVLVEQ